jgi:uncharacterized protein YjbJ (UPF0337 family)
MSTGETIKHRWLQVKGLVQDYIGKMTGRYDKRALGHEKMVRGEVQHRSTGARDQATDGAAEARDRAADGVTQARDQAADGITGARDRFTGPKD